MRALSERKAHRQCRLCWKTAGIYEGNSMQAVKRQETGRPCRQNCLVINQLYEYLCRNQIIINYKETAFCYLWTENQTTKAFVLFLDLKQNILDPTMQTKKYQSHFKMTIYQLAIAIFTSRHYHINVVFDYSKSIFSSCTVQVSFSYRFFRCSS